MANWWRKVGTRRAQAISKVMIAVVRGAEVRVAFGSLGPPLFLPEARRRRARGRRVDRRGAQVELMKEIAPIDDVRSTASIARALQRICLRSFGSETQ